MQTRGFGWDARLIWLPSPGPSRLLLHLHLPNFFTFQEEADPLTILHLAPF